MIIGSPVSEPEFENRARDFTDQARGEIETLALSGHAANKGIETTHGQKPTEQDETLIQEPLMAARSWVVVRSSRWASSRIISTAISGNSPIMRKN